MIRNGSGRRSTLLASRRCVIEEDVKCMSPRRPRPSRHAEAFCRGTPDFPGWFGHNLDALADRLTILPSTRPSPGNHVDHLAAPRAADDPAYTALHLVLADLTLRHPLDPGDLARAVRSVGRMPRDLPHRQHPRLPTGSIGNLRPLDVIGRNRGPSFTVRAPLPAAISTSWLARPSSSRCPSSPRGRQRRGPALRARLACRGAGRAAYAPEVVVGRTPPRPRLPSVPTSSSTGSPERSACARPSPPWRPARPLPWRTGESLIIGGDLVRAAARPDQIVPVDSEHSAIAQSLRGGRREEVRRLVVTASGDPSAAGLASNCASDAWSRRSRTRTMRGWARSSPRTRRPWSTRPEVIEAHTCSTCSFCHDVVVHPQQWIHSMYRVSATARPSPRWTATGCSCRSRRPVLAGSPRRHRDEPGATGRAHRPGVPSARRRLRRPAGADRWEEAARPRCGIHNAANERCRSPAGWIGFLDIADNGGLVVEGA